VSREIKDRQFYLEELGSEECQCGRLKKRGRSFCYTCYSSLPQTLKDGLWLPIGRGYEAAYDAAVEWLDQ